MHFQVPENQIPAFISCLTIGLLRSMQDGSISTDVGIWSLGPPWVWGVLEEKKLVSHEIIEVLQVLDELATVKEHIPDKFDSTITELVLQLQQQLKKMPDQNWTLEWVKDDR